MERTDAELVVAAASGDHDAFAAIYDRYAARIYDLCAHMLRDRDEAADATADVFVKAHEHLGQLRDPTKCKSWLYAIARNEVYRRTRRRRRETAVAMTDDLVPPAPLDDGREFDPALLAGVLREAALGLDERDRLVLELTLAGGLEGRELGDALGVSESAAHQVAHRMRDRLARSVGALLVARQGRGDCAELASLLASWDGTFSVLWRKRVARHVDGCEICERRRKRVPAALFSGTAFAATAVSHLSPPDLVREEVLARTQGPPPTHNGIGWKRDGFPYSPDRRRRATVLGGLAAAIVVLVLLAAGVAGGSSQSNGSGLVRAGAPTVVTGVPEHGPSTSTPTSSTPPAQGPAGGVVVPGTRPGSHAPTTQPGSTGPAPTTAPGTTVPPDTTGPVLEAAIPSMLGEGLCPSNPALTATATDPSGVDRVTLTYQRSGLRSPPLGPVAFTQAGPSSWSLTWNTPTNAGATTSYAVTVTATDGAGNQSTVTQTVTIGACII